MTSNAKIGAFIFAFGLVLGCFLFAPAYSFASDINDFISTDRGLRIETLKYNISNQLELSAKFLETNGTQYALFSDGENNGQYAQASVIIFKLSNENNLSIRQWTSPDLTSNNSFSCYGGYNFLLSVNYKRFISYRITYQSNIYFATTKSEIDTLTGITDALETSRIVSAYLQGQDTCFNDNQFYNYNDEYNLGEAGVPFDYASGVPPAIDGHCGLDNGAYLERTPPTPPRTLCQSGTASGVVWFPYEGWAWTCYGENGGSNDSCLAYITTSPVDAVCGIDDGQTLDNPPENFCLTGSLIFPSYLDTISGYNWTCAGLNGGSPAYCSALKGNITPPIIPENEDCTLLDVPDRWFCQISNAIQNAFLPSSDKLDELNGVVNQIQRKFPFNYISFASDKFSYISGQVSDGTLSITILGNTGNINIDSFSDFIAPTLKTIMYFWISLMFIFWALGYIKHFFK